MTPERWQQIKDVLAEALERPAADRRVYVDRVAGGDDELHREVTSLLAAAGTDGNDTDAGFAADRDGALQAIIASALGQQYAIVRPLGKGGMGAVYLARERALERFVAIKVLRPDLADAPDSRERFRREARVAAQLSHPSILPLHTFGEVGGIWYFVMGYAQGATLGERLRIAGRIPADEAQRILAELADALECAHKHGVVHRDIKPANILLDETSGRSMLADFGIAKVQGAPDGLTGTGVVIGTPHYMSPEQSMGASTVDERSDIYSLGAVAYTMLAGREPFADASAGELAVRRMSTDPVSLQVVAPNVPADLAAIVMRCLARDPADRWPDARSLRVALARASGDSVAALPESLRDLPTFGPYALLWAGAWIALALNKARAPGDRVLLLLIAVVVPFGFLLHIWNVGRPGLGASGIARVAFWPPDWWGMWWPTALRRPTDLWRRLPAPARLLRVALSAFLLILPTMILLRDEIESAVGAGGELEWFGMVESALVIGIAIAMAGALGWAYRLGLSWSETARLLVGATAPSPGWSTPSIVSVLAPATGTSRPPERDTPSDHRRAIADLVPLLPPAAARVGGESVTLARRLLGEIETCDAEIAAIERDAGPSELARLTTRLAELEGSASVNRSGRRELLELVQRELELVRGLREAGDLIRQRRTRLFALLRGLWNQLAVIRDLSPGDPAMTTLVDRVAALCAEIAADLDGSQREASSRLSQARAVAQSRLAVAGEISRASAVSSMVRPPK